MLKKSTLSFDWRDEPDPRVVCGIEIVFERVPRFDFLSLAAATVGAGSLLVLGWSAWQDPYNRYKVMSWADSAEYIQAQVESHMHSPFKAIADALD